LPSAEVPFSVAPVELIAINPSTPLEEGEDTIKDNKEEEPNESPPSSASAMTSKKSVLEMTLRKVIEEIEPRP
jgi:hypothetical protein